LAGRHNLGINEPEGVRVGIDRGRSVIHYGWGDGGGVAPDDLVLVNSKRIYDEFYF
jgi:hypothetical protein